ncbi:hypothetical protein BMR1_03g03525 [Babesia microti strain RI]|uniref:Uncharacterized protein n=1 Tax=Babesia microti (strain RI) TaxID=1133968 RepID=A0A1R4AC59_BABMR|nr:hypothetical protein BMR1_03g03525 [Babesia microti strain RI]SJK86578.1 hypothetical protein BMR1_03g03525 [Babesia microti strain RI]|eukprot:XP_012649316.2 hypothetical protein BMR1_03g03525 [Babesia microti strain RI]
MTKFDILIIFTGILCLNVMSASADSVVNSNSYLKHEYKELDSLAQINSEFADMISIKLDASDLLKNKLSAFIDSIRKSGIKSDFVNELETKFTHKFKYNYLDISHELTDKFQNLKHKLDESMNSIKSLAEKFDKDKTDEEYKKIESEITEQRLNQQNLMNKFAELEHDDLFIVYDSIAMNIEKSTKEFEEYKKTINVVDNDSDLTLLYNDLVNKIKTNGSYIFTWGRRVDFYYNTISNIKNISINITKMINDNNLNNEPQNERLITEANESKEYIVYVYNVLSTKLAEMFKNFSRAQILNDYALLNIGDSPIIDKNHYLDMKSEFNNSVTLFNDTLLDFEHSDVASYIHVIMEKFSNILIIRNKFDDIIKEILKNEPYEDTDLDDKIDINKSYTKVAHQNGWKTGFMIVGIVIGVAVFVFGVAYALFYFKRRELVESTNLIV